MQALYTAATGMNAASESIDVISNNLANQNTTAFKRRRAEFHDLLYINKQAVGAQSSDTGTITPTGIQIGLGVKTGGVYSINEQGSLEKTEADLDVAINGYGFFRVLMPDGTEAYTRAGSFQVDGDGVIVTSDGYEVQPGITIPDDAIDITINKSGEVIVTIPGQVDSTNLGQFNIVRFINEAGLKSMGNNLLIETAASGTPIDGTPDQDGFGAMMQGLLESSNVSSVVELTNLIKAQHAFEMNLKVIEKTDENMSILSQSF